MAGAPPEMAGVPARYREIVPLARLILDGRTTLPTGSGSAGASVLFLMTKIWETYVGRWLRARQPGCAVTGRHRIPLTETRSAWADFVVSRAGEPVAVYDAKYRPWRPDPATDELYQLYTYARRLGITRAALVCPARESSFAETSVGEVTIGSYGVPVERQVNSGS
ncbi:5-methylcytosine restriction system specificity protein McrC [Actinoplanes sp. URMC 104]|uniref:5-methylcytosine restriction system specificity protein McrC n=1 Tax=Actinoplanes sp. URMC 104 TaxID=3423409 RepID=UPI003F1C9F74